MNKIVLVHAPSGTGKGTLINMLLKDFSEIKLSASYTTRKMRKGEADGREYHFVSKQEFENMIENNKFIEYNEYVGNYYGTAKKEVEEKLKTHHVLCEVEDHGVVEIMKAFSKERLLTIFIAPPSIKELENRLRKRGTDNEKVIKQRMAQAEYRMKNKDKFDVIIINDDLDTAYQELYNWIRKNLNSKNG